MQAMEESFKDSQPITKITFQTQLMEDLIGRLHTSKDKNLEITQRIYQFEGKRFESLHKLSDLDTTTRAEVKSEINALKVIAKRRLEAKSIYPIPATEYFLSIQELKREKVTEKQKSKLFKFCHDPKAFFKFKQQSNAFVGSQLNTVREDTSTPIASKIEYSTVKPCNTTALPYINKKVLRKGQSVPTFNKKSSYFSLRNSRINPQRECIEDLIKKCKTEEKAAQANFRSSVHLVKLVKAKLENFKQTSQRISELEYAEPGLMEYLYFQKEREEDFLKDELGEIRKRSKRKFRIRSRISRSVIRSKNI